MGNNGKYGKQRGGLQAASLPEPQFPNLYNVGVGPAQGVSVGSVELLEARFGEGGKDRSVPGSPLISFQLCLLLLLKSLITQALSHQTGRWLGSSALDIENQESTVDTHRRYPQPTRTNMEAVVRPQTSGSCIRL